MEIIQLKAGDSFSVECGSLRLTIHAERKSEPICLHPETDCERDVLAAAIAEVSRTNHRVTAKEILSALDSRQQIWGRSTVMAALAALVRRGLLRNPRDRHGYGLPVQPST